MIYIANDVETPGINLWVHCVISWGACVVTRRPLSKDDLLRRSLLFYSELKPVSRKFEDRAMRVASLGLQCLAQAREQESPSVSLEEIDPHHDNFDSRVVLALLDEHGEDPVRCVARFMHWITTIERQYQPLPTGALFPAYNAEVQQVEPVFDTAYYDPACVKLLIDRYKRTTRNPYGWSGVDIDSALRGRDGPRANLDTLGVSVHDLTHHNALDDAIRIARQARLLGFVSEEY